jgi:hypothetical protein
MLSKITITPLLNKDGLLDDLINGQPIEPKQSFKDSTVTVEQFSINQDKQSENINSPVIV